MVGIASRKENSAAAERFMRHSSPPTMVAPRAGYAGNHGQALSNPYGESRPVGNFGNIINRRAMVFHIPFHYEKDDATDNERDADNDRTEELVDQLVKQKAGDPGWKNPTASLMSRSERAVSRFASRDTPLPGLHRAESQLRIPCALPSAADSLYPTRGSGDRLKIPAKTLSNLLRCRELSPQNPSFDPLFRHEPAYLAEPPNGAFPANTCQDPGAGLFKEPMPLIILKCHKTRKHSATGSEMQVKIRIICDNSITV